VTSDGRRRKPPTAEETAAIVGATAISRGTEAAKSAIVGLLGRGGPPVRLHVGVTDERIPAAGLTRGGYAVHAVYAAKNAAVGMSVAKAIGAWLATCHGGRYEADPARLAVKPGVATVCIAVAR